MYIARYKSGKFLDIIINSANIAGGRSTRTSLPKNVVETSDGKLLPAPGYAWASKEEGDFRVKWSPGKVHSKHSSVIAAKKEGVWLPASGYKWVTSQKNDFRVTRKTSTRTTGDTTDSPNGSGSSPVVAFVQSYSADRVDKEVYNRDTGDTVSLFQYYKFTAQVKIRRTGSYTIRAGFVKDGDWYTGGFTGTKRFWADTTVRGDAGDTVVATVKVYNKPFVTNTRDCRVVD